MATEPKIIFGVDPGSRITGWGCIVSDGRKYKYIDSGIVRLKGKELPPRLGDIFLQLKEIILSNQPDAFVIEEVFVQKNIRSALVLGQARAAAICAAVDAGVNVSEYSPRFIKKAVCGYGNADKDQVKQMVSMLLNLSKSLVSDEADGLAIAITHANQMNYQSLTD